MDPSEAPAPALFDRLAAENSQDDDFFSIDVGGRTARVFRVIRNGVRGAYYVKGYVRGKQFLRCTGYSKKGMAREAAVKIWRAALEERFDILDATKLRRDRPVALVGQIIAAFENHIGKYNLKLKERTAQGYVNALKVIVRSQHPKVETVPSSALTENLIELFFAAHVQAAGDDILKRDARIRGANSTINNARALFSPLAMKCYRDLELPDLKKFLSATTMQNPALDHSEISRETMWEIVQASLCLRSQCAPLYLVHLMYRQLGMRNDEIEHARLSWLEKRPQVVFLPDGTKRRIAGYMSLRKRADWQPKRSSGEIPIDPVVWRELLRLSGAKKPDDYLIQARTPTERAWLVDRDHSEFMRPWVAGHSKTSYELRRWGATLIAKRQGEEAADRFLRHKPKSVAGKHYLTSHALVAPISFRDCLE